MGEIDEGGFLRPQGLLEGSGHGFYYLRTEHPILPIGLGGRSPFEIDTPSTEQGVDDTFVANHTSRSSRV